MSQRPENDRLVAEVRNMMVDAQNLFVVAFFAFNLNLLRNNFCKNIPTKAKNQTS